MKNTIILLCIMFLSAGFVYSEESIIPNAGQWPENILAKASADGINVWITGEGLVFDHYNIKPGLKSPGKFESNALDTISGCAYMLSFSSGKNGSKILNLNTDGETPTVHNYFYDHRSNKAVRVKSYREITVNYQDFSLKLTIDNHKPRYDIILPPGANPGNLKIEFKGDGILDYSDNGSFKVVSGNEEYTHGALKAFQKSGNLLQTVECAPVIRDSKHLTFELGNYDETKELIIDPTVFSTFLGGTPSDCQTICVNNDNNLVLGLFLFEKGTFPDSLSRYSHGGEGREGLVCCFDRDGKYPLWVSHFPEFIINKIAFLDDRSYKLFGFCRDSMPVSEHAYMDAPDFDDQDYRYYSVNLSENGDSLFNGSYWEFTEIHKYMSIPHFDIDSKGNCYIICTISDDLKIIPTEDAIRKERKIDTLPGSRTVTDGGIITMKSDGSDISFSTYFGEGTASRPIYFSVSNDILCITGYDYYKLGEEISYYSLIDLKTKKTISYHQSEYNINTLSCLFKGNNSYYIGSLCREGELPVTPGAHDASDGIGTDRLFLIKTDSIQGKNNRAATFTGAINVNYNNFNQTSNGDFIISGNCWWGDLTISKDALTRMESKDIGEHRGFTMIVSSDLDSILYCTYFGGSWPYQKLQGTAIDSLGRVYYCGRTDSPDFPLKDAYDSRIYPGRTMGFLCAIEYNPGTSVEETQDIRANIFPNPAHPGSLVTLKLNDEFAGETTIELIDLNGRVIKKEKLSLFGAIRQDIQYQLPNELIPGAYFIRVSSGDNIIDFKLVVE